MPQTPENIGFFDAFNPEAVPYAIAWIVGALLLVRLSRRLLLSLAEKYTKHRLSFQQASTIMSFLVYFIAFLLALGSTFTLSSEMLFALSLIHHQKK